MKFIKRLILISAEICSVDVGYFYETHSAACGAQVSGKTIFLGKKTAIANHKRLIFGSCDMRKTVYAAVVEAFIPCVASAEGFYAGVGSVVGASLDEDGTGYAFVIGNEIDKNLSIEGFILILGK